MAAADHQPPLPARVAVAGLGAYPLVLPSLPNAIRTLVESICRAQGVRLQVAAEVDAVQTIVELAAQGDAYAILPRSAARGPAAEHALSLSDIVSPRITNNLVLASARHRPATRPVSYTHLINLPPGPRARPGPMTCDITMTPPTTQNGPLRHFLQFKDFSSAEIAYVLDRARLIKEKFKRYEPHMPLHDRTLAMVFEKASTRTRVSFEAGMYPVSYTHLDVYKRQRWMFKGCALMTYKVLETSGDG